MSVLLIHSHFGPTPPVYAQAIAEGRAVSVRERQLTAEHFANAEGLITTMHLDQVGFMAQAQAATALLDRGGRWFFNGHILRRFVEDLEIYRPLEKPKRPDYALTRLAEHPVFAGIEQKSLEENKGVAGFYGRGYNPLPPDGLAVNGIGPGLHPIDWEWQRPQGGRIFSHAGNDLFGIATEKGHGPVLAERTIAWCLGDIG